MAIAKKEQDNLINMIKKSFQSIGYEYTQGELNKLITEYLSNFSSIFYDIYDMITEVEYYDIYDMITEYVFKKVVSKKVKELNKDESCVHEILKHWLYCEQIRNTIFENYIQEDESIKDFSELEKSLNLFTEKFFLK